MYPLAELKLIADVSFPTQWAVFRLLAFQANRQTEPEQTALALTLGDFTSEPPMVRIHSQCITGEVFHSLRCDCMEQLHFSLRAISKQGAGVVIYEQQEGRGIGLLEKLRAYQLQDQGLDTIEANLMLGHEVDLRDYQLPVHILRFLQINSLRLITNNPDKIRSVERAGIRIVERIPADALVSPFAANYVSVKREKLGHFTNTLDILPGSAKHVWHAEPG